MSKVQEAVRAVGDRGRYQKLLMLLLIFCYIELGLMLFGSTFVFMNPQFECPGMDNPSEQMACPVIEQCTLINTYTATSYAELYCDHATERNIVQSAIYIGAILGLWVLTPLADSQGPKKMFTLAIGLCIVGISLNVVGVYAKAVAVLVVGQLIIGAGGYCILIVGYVILGQLCQDKFKQVGIITLNAVWAIGETAIGALYFWYNQWYNYMVLFLLLPMFGLLLISCFFLVESPFFLITKRREVNAARRSIAQIAAINAATPAAQAQAEALLAEAAAEAAIASSSGQAESKWAIFRDWPYLRLLLLVACVQFGITVIYYGIQFSLGKIGTNFGNNILLMGVIEFFAFLSFNFIITRLPRRKGTFLFNGICVVLCLLFLLDLPVVLQTVLLGLCRWFNAYAMGVVPMLQSEPFPQKYRSSVWGYIEGLSQIGNFITPYIVTACDNAGISTLAVMAVISAILGITPLLFIRETLGAESTDTSEAPQDRLEAGLSINKDDTEEPLAA